MTTKTSTVPALYGALLAGLTARPGLAGVMVTWGWPGRTPEREWLRIADTAFQQETHALGPTRPRKETYDVDMVVSVIRSADGQREAVERAFALMAEVEDFLRLDPTVASTVIRATIGGPGTLKHRQNDNSTEGEVTFTIDVEARI